MDALIVDDSRTTRRIIRQLLTEIGFRVHEAADGQAALDQLAVLGEVELAMIDWNMPVMNGLDLVRALRGNPARSRVRVMMVTSESDSARVSEALGGGADEYVMKPFNKDVILEKLQLLGIEPVAGA